MDIRKDVPLAGMTTFGIGGCADLFCSIPSADVIRLPEIAAENQLTILGEGSNVLISDDGLRGLTVTLMDAAPPRMIAADHDIVEIFFPAALTWDDAVEFAVSRNLQGIECMSGIPGTVGAAPVQNIGAYGQQLSDVVVSVTLFDLATRSIRVLPREACGFTYRGSNVNPPNQSLRRIVTGLTLRLRRGGAPCRNHRDVADATNHNATLTDVRNAVLRIRRRKGMLAGMQASAGSFFKSPEISTRHFERIKSFLSRGATDRNWWWVIPEKRVKIAAGRLVESCFGRGARLGRAGISPRHALALVAYPGAGSDDVIRLARLIQETVADRTDILLEPEVRLLGFESYPLLR